MFSWGLLTLPIVFAVAYPNCDSPWGHTSIRCAFSQVLSHLVMAASISSCSYYTESWVTAEQTVCIWYLGLWGEYLWNIIWVAPKFQLTRVYKLMLVSQTFSTGDLKCITAWWALRYLFFPISMQFPHWVCQTNFQKQFKWFSPCFLCSDSRHSYLTQSWDLPPT